MKIGLKFDDKKIEAATGNPELLDFSYQKKDKHTGELKIRIRDRLRLAFDVPKKSKLKGLYLVVYKPKISTNLESSIAAGELESSWNTAMS